MLSLVEILVLTATVQKGSVLVNSFGSIDCSHPPQIPPSKVLVIGAGVAGLSAIAAVRSSKMVVVACKTVAKQ